MKVVKTYREFTKIKRKYYKRHTVKRVDHFNGRRFTSYWEKEDWLGYIVKTYSELLQSNIFNYIKWMIGPDLFKARLEEIEYLYNMTEPVTITTYSNHANEDWYHEHTGYFRGIVLTNRDAYYLLENKKTNENKLVPIFWNQDKTKKL